jgi:hypothetical protein
MIGPATGSILVSYRPESLSVRVPGTNASNGAVLSRAGTLERGPQYASAIPLCIEPRGLSTALEWPGTIAPQMYPHP